MADLAHELRTLVNGPLARIEAAQDSVLPLPENLAAMREQALRLKRLLDDLASLADAERPGLLLVARPGDVSEVARKAARSFAERFLGGSALRSRFNRSGSPATRAGWSRWR